MKKVLTAVILAAFVPLSHAAIREGVDYAVLSQDIPQLQKNKIEVLEFVGYFCPFCHRVSPIIFNHLSQSGRDVTLRLEHVIWRSGHGLDNVGLARLAAAVSLAKADNQANILIFDAVAGEHQRLDTPAVLQKWLDSQPTFGRQVWKAYQSPKIDAEVEKMRHLTNTYKINSVPTVIVGGRYRVLAHDPSQVIRIIDELIEKVRAEKHMLPTGLRTPPKRIGAGLL